MTDTQKLLNWINQSSKTGLDFSTITVTIMDENVSERGFRFPEVRQISFNPDIDGNRRTMLGKAIKGCINQWHKESSLITGEEYVIMAFKTEGPSNRVKEVTEWVSTSEWDWPASAYWVIGVTDQFRALQFVAIIPRHVQFNSPAVRWLQPLQYSPDLIIDDFLQDNLNLLNAWLEDFSKIYLGEDGKTRLARIDFRGYKV